MTPPRLFLPEYLCICRDENCPIAPGLCHCGCGKKTTIAKMSKSLNGAIRGMPNKYIPGHARRRHNNLNIEPPRKFYVYAYLRSSTSINGPVGSPYYVGKGTRKRAWSNVKRSIPRPSDKENIKIIASGMNENDAFQLEVLLIFLHGRVDVRTGILHNRTDGGEGAANTSEGHRKLCSERQKARWADKPTRLLLLQSLKGKNAGRTHSDATRKKWSEERKGRKLKNKRLTKIEKSRIVLI